MQFYGRASGGLRVSEDRLSVCCVAMGDGGDRELCGDTAHTGNTADGWAVSEGCVDREIQALLERSEPEAAGGVLAIGLTQLEPAVFLETRRSERQQGAPRRSSGWTLRGDTFSHENEDGVVTSERYELDLGALQPGDLFGLRISDRRELCFTVNGVALRAIAEDIPREVWAVISVRGKGWGVSMVPPQSALTRSQHEKMLTKLKSIREAAAEAEADSGQCPVYFHSCCGKEIRLQDDNRVAQRRNPCNEFRNAVVMSGRPLATGALFKVRIEGLINKWNGSIEFGVTIHNPDSFELPATMTNLRSGTLVLSGNSILTNGHGNQLPYSSVNLDDLKIGDEIGVARSGTGDVSFVINGTDLGVAGNISTDIDIWVIIDLYGRTIKVSLPSGSARSPMPDLEDDLSVNLESNNDRLIFHTICGRNVLISQDGWSARRINDQEFNNGIVFTNRPLKIGELWTVKLVRCVQQWAGNLEIGITTMVPSELDFPSTMTDLNIGYTIMLTSNGLVINGCPLSQSSQSLDLDSVHSILLTGIPSLIENCTLGVKLVDREKLQFFMNNTDLGVISLKTADAIYGVIDLYGKAAEVAVYTKDQRDGASGDNITIKSESVNVNEILHSAFKSPFDSSLFSDNISDSDPLRPENDLNEMLINADRSFIRLLTNDEPFVSDCVSVDQNRIKFHHIHGRNVILSNEAKTAYRPSPNNEFKNALVMSSRPLGIDELFEICVEKMTDHWSGSLEMGVTLITPEDLNFPGTLSQLDKDCWILSGSCLMNNGITVRNDYGLDMDNINVHSKIGIVCRANGVLHFLLDDIDMGPAYYDIPTGIYVILDLYGQCSQVSITSRTGTHLPNDKMNITINSFGEFVNSTSRRDYEESIFLLSEGLRPQCTSSLERTMSAIKKSLSSTSEYFSSSKSIKANERTKSLMGDGNKLFISEENKFCIDSVFSDFIFGSGITLDCSRRFFTHNQNLNCVIQFKQPLKTNFYYELLFWNDKSYGYNLEPISFGLISDKIVSERCLPDNLSLVKSPCCIISGGRLFVNNSLRCHSFAPTLTRYKNRILVGFYFYNKSNLEIYVDNVSIGKIVSEIQEDPYLLVNLRGWYNTLVCLGMSPKPEDCLSQSIVSIQLPNHSSGDQSDFPTETGENTAIDHGKDLNVNDDLDIEDPLIVSIVGELSKILPFFFVIMHGIDSKKLTEKIVSSNNDIVLCVRKKILTRTAILQFSNPTSLKKEIQSELIEELSHRFSSLTELISFGNSRFEIARFLRRKIFWDKIIYDEKKIAFIIPQSCLQLEESKIVRTKSGSDFGLCILNQELKSKKSGSHEIQFVHKDSVNNTESKGEFSTSIIGLILLENSHFPSGEDVFRFLISVPCPRRINTLSNNINQSLELQQYESKASTIIIEEDCVYFNGRKICKRMPFNIRHFSGEDYLSFQIVENELEIADIYLSIRNKDSLLTYKVFSQNWLKSSSTIKTIYSTRNAYYYVPFLWLKEQSEAIITPEQKDNTIPVNDVSLANQQDWLEKHYNDELNKESTNSEVNYSLVVNQRDRQCISLMRSVVIKNALTLPDSYFHNKLVDCFCSNCFYPTNGVSTELTKDFRLPFGWVKYNTRFKTDDKFNLSQWKLAYLTASSGFLHRLLTSSNPIHILKTFDNCNVTQLEWLKFSANPSSQSGHKSIVVSPWQPLIGCYVNDDDSINHCSDGLVKCFDPLTNSQVKAKIALEVRVKPNTFKILECKIVTENQMETKRIIPKEIDECGNKKLIECGTARPINQKTVWILNGEENSIVISGLLMKI